MLQFIHMPESGQLSHPNKINALSYKLLRSVKIFDNNEAGAGLN